MPLVSFFPILFIENFLLHKFQMANKQEGQTLHHLWVSFLITGQCQYRHFTLHITKSLFPFQDVTAFPRFLLVSQHVVRLGLVTIQLRCTSTAPLEWSFFTWLIGKLISLEHCDSASLTWQRLKSALWWSTCCPSSSAKTCGIKEFSELISGSLWLRFRYVPPSSLSPISFEYLAKVELARMDRLCKLKIFWIDFHFTFFNYVDSAGTSIISPILPFLLVIIPAFIISEKSRSGLYYHHPVLYLLTFGLLAAKVSCRLVVAHMSKSEMNYFDSGLIGPLILFLNQYFNEFIGEYYVLWIAHLWVTFDLCWYCINVCLEMCDHLNIQLFRIPYPPKITKATATRK